MNINIGVVLHGQGTSSTGNTARIFFNNPDKTAEILNLPKDLIEGFSKLNMFISESKYSEDIEDKFKKCSLEMFHLITQDHFFKMYTMSPTVHRLLVHGILYIQHLKMSLGSLSESALESTNKTIKKFRNSLAFRGNLLENLKNIMSRLLFVSDPKIALQHMDETKKRH